MVDQLVAVNQGFPLACEPQKRNKTNVLWLEKTSNTYFILTVYVKNLTSYNQHL